MGYTGGAYIQLLRPLHLGSLYFDRPPFQPIRGINKATLSPAIVVATSYLLADFMSSRDLLQPFIPHWIFGKEALNTLAGVSSGISPYFRRFGDAVGHVSMPVLSKLLGVVQRASRRRLWRAKTRTLMPIIEHACRHSEPLCPLINPPKNSSRKL